MTEPLIDRDALIDVIADAPVETLLADAVLDHLRSVLTPETLEPRVTYNYRHFWTLTGEAHAPPNLRGGPALTACTCPHEEQSLGRWEGVNMGRGVVRTATTKGCPVHDTCQRYTKADRASRPSWSNPYCPVHGVKDCPDD